MKRRKGNRCRLVNCSGSGGTDCCRMSRRPFFWVNTSVGWTQEGDYQYLYYINGFYQTTGSTKNEAESTEPVRVMLYSVSPVGCMVRWQNIEWQAIPGYWTRVTCFQNQQGNSPSCASRLGDSWKFCNYTIIHATTKIQTTKLINHQYDVGKSDVKKTKAQKN